MNDFKRQYDNDHVIQRLYVHWDVSTQCNFACTYCYAMKEYGDDWGKIDKWLKQQLIIRNISRSTLPVFLGLLGGEPTYHPKYDELVESCHKAISKHEQGRLYVTTNGSRKNSWFEKHKYYNNMYILWSYHSEYEHKYGQGFTTLVDNIGIMLDKGFRSKVNVMLHHDRQYWKKTHKFVDDIESRYGKSIEIHPHFLYADGDVHKLEHYSEDFYKEFQRFENYPEYLVFEKNDGTKTTFNDYSVFKNTFTSFKGWDCWNNNYEISYDGYVHRVCFEDRVDLIRDIQYFKNIKQICPVTCPHMSCNCDGLLKIHKESVV